MRPVATFVNCIYIYIYMCVCVCVCLCMCTHTHTHTQGDSKRWTQLKSKRCLNIRQTVGYGIPSSLLVLQVDLRGLRSKLLNSSHVLLWYTWSAGAFAFTQTAYLLKLLFLVGG